MLPAPVLRALCAFVLLPGCRQATTYELEPERAEPAADPGEAEPEAPVEAGAPAASDDGPAGAPPPADALDPACTAPAARVAELADGSVRDGARIELSGLVATSYEFLVYRSESTGACLWGVYAGELDASMRAGVLLVSYGEPAPSADADCPRGAPALLGGVEPGMELVAVGEAGRHAPAACADGPGSVQLRVEPRCPLRALGQGTAPAPAPLAFADADAIARGDAGALAALGGALVELHAVSAAPVPGEDDAVAPYGVIRLVETALEVHDALAFMDVRGAGPGDFDKAFEFAYPVEFSRLTGLVHLDYCTWSLAPREACGDFAPSAAGCAR